MRPGPGGGSPQGEDDFDPQRLRGGYRRVEERPDGSWVVTGVSGRDSTKTYRCPGCDQEIRSGTPHVVVWSAEALGAGGGLGDRRHWHTPCWSARERRGR